VIFKLNFLSIECFKVTNVSQGFTQQAEISLQKSEKSYDIFKDNSDQGWISCLKGVEGDSWRPTFSHLFEAKNLGAKVMKKELNFLKNSVDCKGKFSSQKVERRGAELPLFTRNPPQVLLHNINFFNCCVSFHRWVWAKYCQG
jgi:hypothetical protein